MKSRNPSGLIGRLKLPALGLVVLALAFGLFLFFRPTPAPRLTLTPTGEGGAPLLVGRTARPLTITVDGLARDLTAVRVELIQGDTPELLTERVYAPTPGWAVWQPQGRQDTFDIEVGRAVQPELAAGPATLRVTAERAAVPLRSRPPVVVEQAIEVRLRPPSLSVLSSQNYAAQGGSGVVVYRVSETAQEPGGRDGVVAGNWFFTGYPLPGGDPAERFCLYAVPYDLDQPAQIRLVAGDSVGNEATASFLEQFFPRPMGTDTIELNDAFLAKVVPEILAQTPEIKEGSDLLASYLTINGDLRRQNNTTLKELAQKSRPERRWTQPFRQLPSSQVTSNFADRRTYVYNEQRVDQQDHLGFDLASVKHAPVPAANQGKVVLARYFGIYGNTVVLDHGYGLASLYSHLSSIAVQEGQEVQQDEVLGRTGDTGLAGGDHLHFTILVGGLPVSPVEWWDPKWIRERLLGKLEAAGASATPATGS